MNFEGVRNFVIEKLRRELNSNLYYHSLEHTLDVEKAVARLADLENVNGHEKYLLKTGALFHDLGFVETYDGHEDVSIRMAQEMLPEFGYNPSDIKIIQGLIKCTEIPQSPKNHLEKIMADADLDYLGRDDIFLTGQKLQYEWKLRGKVSSLREWHETQLKFIKNHNYFTPSAKKLREEGKQSNIQQLEILMCLKK
jgi:predicted metal-dependent HD superfamily phosphohydrolase